MHRPHALARAAAVAAAAVVTLAACGGGGSSAGAAVTTSAAPPTASSGGATEGTAAAGRGGPGGGRFGAQAQAFTQCLQAQGLTVTEPERPTAPAGGEGAPPADGSRPRFDGQPPTGAGAPTGEAERPAPDPAQMASRLAARLGLDMTDETVAAAVATCAAQLG